MRPGIATAALLLASCAAPPAGQRFVYLESESYGCGAAEGLGCGLAIAPLLESIDALEGVAESSVSWDGRQFRIEVLPGADADQVAIAAAALLEGDAVCVPDAPRGTAAAGKPDRWFNAEQTIVLSRHEAEVIAADFTAEITAEVQLEEDATRRIESVLREELERAFEVAHAAGGGVARLREQLPEAWPRLEARLAEFLTPEQQAHVTAIVAREIEE